MGRFLARRLLQMIPTLLGVIVVVFIVFNVVGGSPAELALGKGASPQSLEEFDEARGANKPLLIGRWSATRALAAVGATNLPAGAILVLTPAFPLRAGETYRLTVDGPAPSTLAFDLPGKAARSVIRGSKALGVFRAPEAGRSTLTLRNGAGSVAVIRGIRLERRNRHLLDTQFFDYLARLARGDLGYSFGERQRVARILREGIGPTLSLTLPIFAVGLITAVALSLYCAWYRNGWIDRFFVVVSVALMSVNYLVWIVLGQYVLGFRLGWFPVWGFESAKYVLLPAIIGVMSGLGADLRLYRTVMLEEVGRDYVRTARAKGVTPRRVLFGHVLRNALVPVVTSAISALPYLYTGSLLLESFFGIPGLGYLGVNAINNSDADVVRAIVVIGAVLFMAANLLCDFVYVLIDPRVKPA